jgi:hypothetical protein
MVASHCLFSGIGFPIIGVSQLQCNVDSSRERERGYRVYFYEPAPQDTHCFVHGSHISPILYNDASNLFLTKRLVREIDTLESLLVST